MTAEDYLLKIKKNDIWVDKFGQITNDYSKMNLVIRPNYKGYDAYGIKKSDYEKQCSEVLEAFNAGLSEVKNEV